jgi:PAS domain S-box-containing protein
MAVRQRAQSAAARLKELVSTRLEYLYNLFESSFEFLLVVDTKENVVHASRLLCQQCGLARESIVGHRLQDFLDPASLEGFHAAMQEVRKGRKGTVGFSVKGGNTRVIPLKVGYAEVEEGGLYLFYGVQAEGLTTLSEWEKIERIKELTAVYAVADWIESSSSIKEFFTELPTYLARGMHYPEHAVIYSVYQGVIYGQKPASKDFIRAALEINGQAAGEIIVGYVSDEYELLPEEQKMINEIARMLNVALERKELSERLALKQEEEAEYARKLAELETVIESRTKELDDQHEKLNRVNDYIGRVQHDWEESKVRLETMFQAIPDRVALIDLKRNVVMTNRENVLPGDKCYRTFFGSDSPCMDCRLMRVVREKAPVTMEIKHDDSFYEVHALPIFNQKHEVEGIIEFYRDITIEKTYEQQLQQADKLASLGQLVSGIGHEINNPNQFIRGNIKILQQALEDMLPIIDEYYKDHPDLKIARLKYDFFREHAMTLVNDMSHGSERIKGIVEGLKRFARKDEGLLVDEVDINTLIDASARLVHNQVHKSADIELDLAGNIPAFTGNSQKIEQIIINLLINAGQAMPDDRRGLIRVKTRIEDSIVCVDVSDNGKGMTEETRKHIFEPFFTTRRSRGGTGLGLAIAYRIIEELGGKITVSSKPGVGTTFSIRIPVKRKPAEGEEAGGELGAGGHA